MSNRKSWPIVWAATAVCLLSAGLFERGPACAAEPQHAADARIAVAANFAQTAKDIAKAFAEETATRVEIVSGSTGNLYAQIENGAPFDAFFAADVNRPELLEKKGKILKGSRFTYARGALVLWSPKAKVVDAGGQILRKGNFARLAIANPKLAPYGLAAQQVLEKLGLWDRLHDRIVIGQNISQTYQFVYTANADIGFVSLSQLQRPDEPLLGSYWKVPPSMHGPIDQQAVRLTDNPAAGAFVEFLRTRKARRIIESYGYVIPKPDPKPRPEETP